jgi:hypothetical protein
MPPKSTSPTLITIPNSLLVAKELVYDKCGFNITDLKAEAESADYSAYTFTINNRAIIYRAAKITPTKTGQLVTLWKRNNNGPIEPLHLTDEIDLFIISTKNEKYFGQFIFPKSVLHSKGILSDDNKEGKRAIRVYPPWDKANSKQAIKTQQWQLDYFLPITGGQPIDLIRANQLLSNT